DKHEQVLIFTQFKEMCEPLNEFLAEVFGKSGLVLHGSVPAKKRAQYVQEFNSSESYTPYMVLSIKAGGVGVNLTAANHVIHFDRWWNPAVENQATDRAFRIGQEKNVFVYKFVTTGTIEEKIDEMLSEKTQLSNDLISETSGENWLTEMSNQELKQLFTLEAN
ncbi:MAG: SWF/SNF helicase family protein, partial [Enterococcaceae bacterium]|nr:SWF/SNF helicase family protein [Tetragenococcus halophilus]MDN6470163.1 SWF/SNF helicase family protein [Enterococcaceae bacterium]MDN6710932.1 SWF/SNF helicase family protein [Tetragenococcus halophilus]